jgi:peptide/nickel transport system substrate-binding protein
MRTVALLLALFAVVGCTPAQPAATGTAAAPAGTTLRFGESGEPRSLNPIFNDLVASTVELNFLYDDPLWVRDQRGTLVPRIAARIPTPFNHDISADGRTVTVHLRHDVRWQDGAPFTSADVQFSWQAVMDPRNNVGSLEGYDQVARIDAPDAYTAVVHLKRRYARAVPASIPPLIPAHLLRNVALNTAPFNAEPVGTGPYKVVAWKRGELLDLVANDRYYLGKPKIGRIVVRFVPYVTTRAVMLKTGELDLAELDRDAYRQIADAPNVAFAVEPDHSTEMYFLNVMRPHLRDVRVRRAVALAFDRASLVHATAFKDDVGQLANGYADPLLFAYNRMLAPLPYDPKTAAQLLDEAGWRRGADGIRVRDGERLTLQIAAIPGATSDMETDIQAQAMLRDVGIDADIKTYPQELIFAPAASHGVLANGTFDMFLGTYGNDADPDSSWILTCARVEPHGYNESHYCNPELDRLEAAALATYDPAERARFYAQIDDVLARDVPIVFVAWPKAVFGMNPRLKGFTFNGLLATWNAAAWSL